MIEVGQFFERGISILKEKDQPKLVLFFAVVANR
jgi:hypothetical protein